MLIVKPQTLEKIAANRGWLHTKGRLVGTVNVAAMAKAIGMDRSTVMRAYEGGPVSSEFLARIVTQTGVSLDELVTITDDNYKAVA